MLTHEFTEKNRGEIFEKHFHRALSSLMRFDIRPSVQVSEAEQARSFEKTLPSVFTNV